MTTENFLEAVLLMGLSTLAYIFVFFQQKKILQQPKDIACEKVEWFTILFFSVALFLLITVYG